MEYSLAAGVRAKVDRFRLRLGGWTDQDLGDVIASSTDADEDRDVKAERLRVDQAMGRLGRSRAPPGNGDQDSTAETETGMDTVLIRGLAKVGSISFVSLVLVLVFAPCPIFLTFVVVAVQVAP